MSTKLTLTVDGSVIGAAKKYAHKRGKSLSHIVENYLMSISKKESDQLSISPKVSKLIGVIDLPKNFNYKVELQKAIVAKYKK